MIPPALARALRRSGYDVISCHEVGRGNRAISDEDQLEYATQDERAILTFNTTDFVRLDAQWHAAQRIHAGIIIVPRPLLIRQLIRYVARHLDRHALDSQRNLVLWLDTSQNP